jgi:hypothetical protein
MKATIRPMADSNNETDTRSAILEKRVALRKLVKKNTKCHHLQVYTEANAVCRRITVLYEEDKISMQQAMKLIFETHEQLSHKNLPKDTVAQNIHKLLDKLDGADKTTFGIIMANTNSSVHVKGGQHERTSPEAEKYSESYWADVI